MHGDIGVRSEYGKGSVFSFDILQGTCGDEPILDFDDPDDKNTVIILATERNDKRILEVEAVLRELGIKFIYCSTSEDVEKAMVSGRIVAVFSYKNIYSDYVDWFEGIGKPVIARSSRQLESYFVNERFVTDNTVSKAIEDGYAGFLMQHRFPLIPR